MPSTQQSSHPSGLGITFHEDGHVYRDDNGMEYTSGTAIVSRVKPKFDPDGSITNRCADRAGVTVEQLKAQWKAKGDKACTYGTRMHEAMERQFKGEFNRIPRGMSPLEENTLKIIWDMVTSLQSKYRFIAAEQIVFSPPLHIAGSIDLLLADDANRILWVPDLKTNEKLERESSYGNKMLEPVAHLDDCSLSHYSIQLGLYSRLIASEGYLEANGMAGYDVRGMLLWNQHMADAVEYIPTLNVQHEIAEILLARAYDIPF